MKLNLWILLLTITAVTLLPVGHALAQGGDPGSYPSTTNDDDGGFDAGWLGLLGLFGLMGLKKRHERDDHLRHTERHGAPA